MTYRNYDKIEAELNPLLSPSKIGRVGVGTDRLSLFANSIFDKKVTENHRQDVSIKTGEMLVCVLAQLKSIDKTGIIHFKSWSKLSSKVGMCGNTLKKYCLILQKYGHVSIGTKEDTQYIKLYSFKQAVYDFLGSHTKYHHHLRFYKIYGGKLIKFNSVRDRYNYLQECKHYRYYSNVQHNIDKRSKSNTSRGQRPGIPSNGKVSLNYIAVGASSGHLANKVSQSKYMCRKTMQRMKMNGSISTELVETSLYDVYKNDNVYRYSGTKVILNVSSNIGYARYSNILKMK